MKRLSTTLEQWRCADAVVRDGGFSQAAASLNKSQSSISHAVRELSERLNVEIFEVVGRKAKLTPGGETLLRQARRLLDQAQIMEETAEALAKGTEIELSIAVDAIIPNELVIDALNTFSASAPETHVTICETALSGTEEALTEGQVDMAISALVPLNFIAIPLVDIEFVAVAARDHPLHKLDRDLELDDLRQHRQLVVRDSGRESRDAGWLGAEQRWTFSSPASSLDALRAGSGFAWIPICKIADDLRAGKLLPLRLGQAGSRRIKAQIVSANPLRPGTAADALAKSFLESAKAIPDHAS